MKVMADFRLVVARASRPWARKWHGRPARERQFDFMFHGRPARATPNPKSEI